MSEHLDVVVAIGAFLLFSGMIFYGILGLQEIMREKSKRGDE